MIELLLWATPLGLLIDIGGFTLVVLYGHDLFIRPGTFEAPERERPGILYYFTNEGPSDESLPRPPEKLGPHGSRGSCGWVCPSDRWLDCCHLLSRVSGAIHRRLS